MSGHDRDAPGCGTMRWAPGDGRSSAVSDDRAIEPALRSGFAATSLRASGACRTIPKRGKHFSSERSADWHRVPAESRRSGRTDRARCGYGSNSRRSESWHDTPRIRRPVNARSRPVIPVWVIRVVIVGSLEPERVVEAKHERRVRVDAVVRLRRPVGGVFLRGSKSLPLLLSRCASRDCQPESE